MRIQLDSVVASAVALGTHLVIPGDDRTIESLLIELDALSGRTVFRGRAGGLSTHFQVYVNGELVQDVHRSLHESDAVCIQLRMIEGG